LGNFLKGLRSQKKKKFAKKTAVGENTSRKAKRSLRLEMFEERRRGLKKKAKPSRGRDPKSLRSLPIPKEVGSDRGEKKLGSKGGSL